MSDKGKMQFEWLTEKALITYQGRIATITSEDGYMFTVCDRGLSYTVDRDKLIAWADEGILQFWYRSHVDLSFLYDYD